MSSSERIIDAGQKQLVRDIQSRRPERQVFSNLLANNALIVIEEKESGIWGLETSQPTSNIAGSLCGHVRKSV